MPGARVGRQTMPVIVGLSPAADSGYTIRGSQGCYPGGASDDHGPRGRVWIIK